MQREVPRLPRLVLSCREQRSRSLRITSLGSLSRRLRLQGILRSLLSSKQKISLFRSTSTWNITEMNPGSSWFTVRRLGRQTTLPTTTPPRAEPEWSLQNPRIPCRGCWTYWLNNKSELYRGGKSGSGSPANSPGTSPGAGSQPRREPPCSLWSPNVLWPGPSCSADRTTVLQMHHQWCRHMLWWLAEGGQGCRTPQPSTSS